MKIEFCVLCNQYEAGIDYNGTELSYDEVTITKKNVCKHKPNRFRINSLIIF